MSRHKVVVRAFLTSDRRHPTSQSRTADSTRVFNTTCRSKVAPCLCRYLGTTGKRLWHDPAMRLPSACDSRKVTARQRDSRDRITGLRLAATTVRAIPTPSPGQRKGGSISASPAKRPLGCSERCIRNLAARQRWQSQRFLRLPMLRLHWRRPAIRGKIQSRRFSVAHKSQRLIGTLRRECLDHVLIVGEQHLRRMLASYSSSYYNESPRTWRWRRMGRSASYPEVRSDHHHANSFRTAPSLCFQSQGIHWKYEPKAAILFALILLGDDDGSGHCEVVQSNEGLWIHSAARWRRQRCVRTHQRSRTRRSEFTQRRTDR